jgi:hypothetical protein
LTTHHQKSRRRRRRRIGRSTHLKEPGSSINLDLLRQRHLAARLETLQAGRVRRGQQLNS